MENLRDRDRVGLAWRRDISSHVLLNADKIDLIEVALDEYVLAPATKTHGLVSLMREIPTCLHGTSLGLAGPAPLDELRLERLRRILDRLGACDWSERLIDPATVTVDADLLQRNLELVRERLGRAPDLESAAAFVAPDRLAGLCADAGADLLLDLHDVYAHAVNRGADPLASLLAYPLELVRRVHLSGGQWVEEDGGRRLTDDHHHDVSAPVFELLEELAARADHPLSVVVERDGNFPPFSYLLHELGRAREALTRGRRRRQPRRETPVISLAAVRGGARL